MLQQSTVAQLLSLIIPAYNERRRLPLTLRELGKYLASRSGPVEIVLVDDGSSDDTAAVARAHAEEFDLDFLVYGSVEQIADYLFLEISVYERAGDSHQLIAVAREPQRPGRVVVDDEYG